MRHCFLTNRAKALTAGAVLATAAMAQAGFVLDLRLAAGGTTTNVSANQVINLEVWGTVTGGTSFKGIQDAFFGVTNTGTANGDLSVVSLTNPFSGVATDATPNPTTSSGGTLYGAAGQKSVGSTNNAVADGWVFARSTSMTDVTAVGTGTGAGQTGVGPAGSRKLGTLTYTAAGSVSGSTTLTINPRTNPTNSALIVPALYKEDGTTFDTAASAGTSVTLTAGVIVVHNAGDVNNDKVVDQLDLNIVNGNWQSPTNIWESGDMNNDGVVDQLDLNLVNSNWQVAYPPAPNGIALASSALVAVPEPATLGLVMGASLLTFARRRRS
jgi:hypothetical protein